MKVIALSLLYLFIAGCGASSPRFVSHESPQKSEKPEKKNNGPRFSSKHIDEEKKEDDRKVDVKEVVARFSSAKPSPSTTPPPMRESSVAVPRSSAKTPAGRIDDQKMMDVILGYLGTPYAYGGESKSGIDCSAFTSAVYDQSVNVKLSRTATDQVKEGSPVSFEDLKFGDLMFFNTTGTNPSHVGIYIGDDLFAHASEAFGVTISSIESSYYKKRYTESRRIIK
jgi:cell wall-associated NlpC family hydrolase